MNTRGGLSLAEQYLGVSGWCVVERPMTGWAMSGWLFTVRKVQQSSSTESRIGQALGVEELVAVVAAAHDDP
jgi:hypothetical protein